MRSAHRFSIAAVAASALLASCSGGSHAGPGPVLPATSQAAATSSGAQFTVSVARQQSQAANRQTAAVSLGVASLVITASGAGNASATVNVAAGAPGCTSTTTTLSCTGTINVVPGTYTFAVKEYSAANGTGTLLGSGSVAQIIAPGALTNITLTLNGVVSSIQLALNPTTVPSGTATTATLTVMAMDASGNVIVGPGIYVDANGNPVTIAVTSNGGSGITLGSSQVTAASNAAVTVTYSGASVTAGTQALFHATATGFTAAQAAALTFTAPGTRAGSLYLVNQGFFEQYSADGQSQISQLFSPTYPETIGYDGAGNLYLIAPNTILVYAAGTGTSGTPLRKIGGSNFPPAFASCYCNSQFGVPGVDSQGAVYAVAPSIANNAVQVYSASASGNVAPDKTWTISSIAGTVTDVAVDTDGTVYVASNNENNTGTPYTAQLDVFPSSTPSGAVTPVRTITMSSPYYSGAQFIGLGFDAQHNAYAFDIQSNVVSVIAAGTPSGAYSPATFGDSNSYGFYGFGVEQSGAVDIVFYGPQNHIDHFAAGSSGFVTPAQLLSSSSGFNYATGLAVSPAGTVGVVDSNNTSSIETYAAAALAAGGSSVASSTARAIPFGVGYVQNATVAPNGDIVVAGTQGPDAIDIYSAGTLALGNPSRSISAVGLGNIGSAFEDANGYLYATEEGPGGRGGDAVARRAGAAVSARAKAMAAIAAQQKKTQALRKPAGYVVSGNEIAVFAPGASGSVLPIRTIETPLQYVAAPTVAADGTIYAVGPGSALVYAPGTSTPARTIPYTIPPSGNCCSAYIIAVDALGWIYFSEGSVIFTVAPASSTVTATFPITSRGSTNPVLVTDANNLYVAVDAGFESYPLSSVRALSGTVGAPPLNAGVLPAYDPAFGSAGIYSAFFGN